MQSVTEQQQIHSEVENLVLSSSLREIYLEDLKAIGQTISSCQTSPINIQEKVDRNMTVSKRRAVIFSIIANAHKEPLYHLSPTNFMKMYSRELEWLCSIPDDESWDEVSAQILHEADQCMIPYNPSNPDFVELEDVISEYKHYLFELNRKFEAWTVTADDLRYEWEDEFESEERSVITIDRTRL